MDTQTTVRAINVPTFCASSSVTRLNDHGSVLLENENGRVSVADVVVFASSDAEGIFAARDIDGVIGSELLRKMGPIVIFDAPHHRLILRATQHRRSAIQNHGETELARQ